MTPYPQALRSGETIPALRNLAPIADLGRFMGRASDSQSDERTLSSTSSRNQCNTTLGCRLSP